MAKNTPSGDAARPSPPAKKGDLGVEATLARHGGLSYLEIPAIDVRRSATFYINVLNWTVEEDETGRTKFRDPSGHLIGRWLSGRNAARSSRLTPYFYVNHVDDAVKRVLAHDGEVVKTPYTEGNTRIATVRDPAGNVIGLWQQA